MSVLLTIGSSWVVRYARAENFPANRAEFVAAFPRLTNEMAGMTTSSPVCTGPGGILRIDVAVAKSGAQNLAFDFASVTPFTRFFACAVTPWLTNVESNVSATSGP